MTKILPLNHVSFRPLLVILQRGNGSLGLSLSIIGEMKAMKNPVDKWRQHDADNCDECQAAEERVTAGKDFARVRFQFSQRTHAGKDH
ncbi:MAG: hypothetical protein KGJ37_02265, partial [Verrucomicrobiota bacterium]|nr:hypothetical protein [Verrucomicrobiota bacterium]